MDRYEGAPQFRPISAWGYIGYSFLFAIPLVGLILAIEFACSNENINRRNYARSMLLGIVIAIVLVLIISLCFGISITQLANSYSRYY